MQIFITQISVISRGNAIAYTHLRFKTAARYDVYSVILSVLDPRKCEYLKDYSLDFEHAYMTTYLAS